MKSYKPLVVSALFCAISVILTRTLPTFDFLGAQVRLNFGLIPIILCGLYYGKYYGLSCGLLADLIGVLINPMGPAIIPLIMAGSAAMGLFAGFFKNKKTNHIALILIILIANLIYSFFATFGLVLSFGLPINSIFIPRTVFCLVMVPLHCIICLPLHKTLKKIL